MPINSVHVSSFFHRSFGTMIFVVFISVLFNCCECVCKTVVGEVNVISTFGHFFWMSLSLSLHLSFLLAFSSLCAVCLRWIDGGQYNGHECMALTLHFCLPISRSLPLWVSVCRTCSSKKACACECVRVFRLCVCERWLLFFLRQIGASSTHHFESIVNINRAWSVYSLWCQIYVHTKIGLLWRGGFIVWLLLQ